MVDIATLETQLAEARTALHRLMTEGQTVSVEYDGRRVQYSTATASRLEAYIATLEQRIARATGTGRRRALRVTF